MSRKIFAGTIVAKNYVSYARVWARSFLEHHPDSRVFVLLSDRNDGLIDADSEPFELIEVASLGISELVEMAFRYDVMELSTAVKPAFLDWLLNVAGGDIALYFDPDILILDRVSPVLDALEDANVVLTPHALSPLPTDGLQPTEGAFLVSGSYNLGFIGVRRSPETNRMLSWWASRLVKGCASAPEKGLFTDQKWIDLVPSFFEGVTILRDPSLNIAYWNLHARGDITEIEGRYFLGGEPVRFFHFSGLNPEDPSSVSKHQNRFHLTDLSSDAQVLFHRYASAVLREGFRTTRKLPYAYGSFEDGEPVNRLLRMLYQRADSDGLSWSNPFAAGEGSFREWALSPGPGGKALPLASLAWELRSDLRIRFPLGPAREGPALLGWLQASGGRELGLGPGMLATLEANSKDSPAPIDLPVPPATTISPPQWWDFIVDDPPLLPGERASYKVPPGSLVTRLAQRLLGVGLYRRLRFRYWCGLFHPDRAATSLQFEGPLAETDPEIDVDQPVSGNPRRRTELTITPVEEPFGVNLFGYLDTESGIGEISRCFVRMLEAAGVPVAPITVDQDWLRRNDHSIEQQATTTPFPVNLFFVNADQLPQVLSTRRAVLEGRKNVGYWFWELEKFPEDFDPALRLVDEVWVASTFCQRSISARADLPVVWVPPRLDSSAWPGPDRPHFGLSDDDFVILNVFDAASFIRRKNPGAVVSAFRKAFPLQGREILILKTANATHKQVQALQRLAGGSRVRIMNGYASREEILSLIASADVSVSLHRSEGLGLTLLEAMAYSKPVISTPYGGCYDFLSFDSAMLVPYRRVRVGRNLGPYAAESLWADPDVDAAAAQMRMLAADPAAADRIGTRGNEMFHRWAAGSAHVARSRISALSAAARMRA